MTAPRTPSRGPVAPGDEELRLPRPPGVIRQLWARHPLFADVLIAVICLLLSVAASAVPRSMVPLVGVAGAVLIGVVILASSVLLVWRRRWSVATLIVAVLVDVVLLWQTGSPGASQFAVTVYGLALYRSSRASGTGLGAGVATISVLAFSRVLFEGDAWPLPVSGLFGHPVGVRLARRWSGCRGRGAGGSEALTP